MSIKAAYLKRTSDILIKNVDLDSVNDHEIRLKVLACGICGTDVSAAIEGKPEHQPFGHEVAGIIIELGRSVTNLKEGQTIVLESSSACGRCCNCRNGIQELCTDVQSFWPRPPYGCAEEMISPAICAVPYTGISPELACISEPLGVAIDMHRLADIKIGSHVVVSGLGTIGLLAIQLAKASGAERIYACDLSCAKKRLQLAEEFGADEVIEVDKSPLETYKFIQAPDRFMITSPPMTLPTMVSISAKGGIISYIGIKYGKGGHITFDANLFHFNKLQMRGSFASPALYTPRAIHLIKEHIVKVKPLITHILGLDELHLAMDIAANNIAESVKVIIKP